jgi:O-antigen/teichoic acid export membrane protein
LSDNSFVRDVTKLSFGTIGGRLIALAALPIVTRLYTPQDFALLAVYLGVVSTVAIAACLRLEIAIPLAENDGDAAHLLALSLLAAGIVTGVIGFAVILAPRQTARLLGTPGLAPFLWLVPIGILIAAAYSALQYWATRARRFGSIARTRVTQAAAGVATMLGLGWLGLAPLGLLVGNMLNLGAGGLRLGVETLRRDLARLRLVSWRGMWRTLRDYRRYPIYSMPESLINVAGMKVPIILIAAFAGAEAGFLFLAMQVMAAPMTLLGSSISQVYMSRANDEMRAGRLSQFTLGIMRRLAMIGVGPLILVGLLAPTVFPWIFGTEWHRAGVLVAWLVPWMVFQFVASPVSMVMFVVGWQKLLLSVRIVALLIRVCSVLVPAYFFDHLYMVETFAVANAIIYFSIGALFMQASKASALSIGRGGE